ncbi:hypothetical protein FC86_GL001211 [Holzapfeliella floricola DSM 23037 = JCM 16512]|uniref:Ribosomal RNA large subunit methyltransferase H n=2 Tax=Holzapfeliella TaxID=2767883 RepID=A0A0R2DXB5_9LACO|nr:hypothetical protein FC86_GL001211 [Holzapfeliella floricola DSM 23037 = JCM 16512]
MTSVSRNKGVFDKMPQKIVCVGKLKEKYLKSAIDEYQKRMQRFGKLNIVEVPDEKAPQNMSDKEIEQVKDKEGEKILSKINDQDFVITLEILGKEISSEKLAQNIKDWTTYGHSSLVFVIGGSNGLSEAVMKRSNYALSFGKMTLPHQLMRVVLCEQVYRAFMINSGSAYHK